MSSHHRYSEAAHLLYSTAGLIFASDRSNGATRHCMHACVDANNSNPISDTCTAIAVLCRHGCHSVLQLYRLGSRYHRFIKVCLSDSNAQDLARTFPDNIWLRTDEAHRMLRRVLLAYSIHNPSVQYVILNSNSIYAWQNASYRYSLRCLVFGRGEASNHLLGTAHGARLVKWGVGCHTRQLLS